MFFFSVKVFEKVSKLENSPFYRNGLQYLNLLSSVSTKWYLYWCDQTYWTLWPCWQLTMMSSIIRMSHDLSQPIRTWYPRLENLTVVAVAVVVGIPHSSGHWLAIASKNKLPSGFFRKNLSKMIKQYL